MLEMQSAFLPGKARDALGRQRLGMVLRELRGARRYSDAEDKS